MPRARVTKDEPLAVHILLHEWEHAVHAAARERCPCKRERLWRRAAKIHGLIKRRQRKVKWNFAVDCEVWED